MKVTGKQLRDFVKAHESYGRDLIVVGLPQYIDPNQEYDTESFGDAYRDEDMADIAEASELIEEFLERKAKIDLIRSELTSAEAKQALDECVTLNVYD